MPRVIISSLLLLALAHCGEPPEEIQEDLPELQRTAPATSDHGPIALGSAMETELSRQAAIHSWQFTLGARAAVTLATTFSVANPREVDTVLVLQRTDGKFVAQNDDVDGTRFSRITRTLAAGSYRVQAHGFSPRTHGRFAFNTSCAGAGCPAPEPHCYFGGTFSDLRSHASLTITSETWIKSPAQIAEIERAQLVLAVQQSSHTEVSTPEEAIDAVDEDEVRRMELHDADGSVYLAFEYGAGDNSYGAIFAAGSTALLASIHDGDLLDCTKLE